MLKKIVFSFALVIAVVPAFSQASTDSVKAAVNQLFIAMKTSDQTLLLDCFADSAILQTVMVSNGKVTVRSESISGFARQIAALPKNAADERITFDMIKADGCLATVWTPYQFYYNGRFLHCGVNSFQLVKINGRWKIQYIIDTRRKDDCN